MDTDAVPVAPQVQARRLLSLFQFPAARWNDRVGRLSGGEKRRLQLLKVLATSPNFLVLDEPTNDLDILSLQVGCSNSSQSWTEFSLNCAALLPCRPPDQNRMCARRMTLRRVP